MEVGSVQPWRARIFFFGAYSGGIAGVWFDPGVSHMFRVFFFCAYCELIAGNSERVLGGGMEGCKGGEGEKGHCWLRAHRQRGPLPQLSPPPAYALASFPSFCIPQVPFFPLPLILVCCVFCLRFLRVFPAYFRQHWHW